jgi:hypothetical protein
MAIRDILRPFGIFMVIRQYCGKLVYFSLLRYIVSRKIWQPWSKQEINFQWKEEDEFLMDFARPCAAGGL